MRIGISIFLLMASILVRSQVLINEVCPANGDILYDPQFFNFSSWVELYNPGNNSINVSGYYLSDSPALPLKWVIPSGTSIPAKGYLLIWCDNMNVQLHTSFSIETDEDEIILSSPAGVLVDQIAYTQQFFNTSFSRVTDGSPSWNYASVPTPAKANITGPANGLLPKVEFGMPSGRYSGNLLVTLSDIQAGIEIRYTTDGSEPTLKSTKYVSTFSVSQTTVVKAKAFHPDYLPSETTSVTYFLNEHEFTIPVVSFSANPKYLFNDTLGVYADGTNGIIKYCSTVPKNWNQDWDRHAVFEYLNPSGVRNYQQHLTFRIAGNCSRTHPQKSFALKARKEFGSGKLSYPFFASEPIQKYDEIFLRNSGQDVNNTQFRDAFLQTIPLGMMDVDYMAYQPSALYINGQYWGVQNLREKIDGDFIENNYGISKDDIDMIENYSKVVEGSTDAWFNYLDSLALLNPTDPNTFRFIEKHLDVQEYINWLVLEVYYANTDWPNNGKFWRQRSTNGKFRWILWDLDLGFSTFSSSGYLHPTLDFATDPASTGDNRPTFTKPIRLALAVPEFRNRFIASLATAMGSTLEPGRVVGMINQFKTRIEAEMPYHKQRWGGTFTDWENDVQRLRVFALERSNYMRAYVASFFNLSQASLATAVTPALSGKVELNGVTTSGIPYVPFYAGVGYTIKALPKPGFQLQKWAISNRNSQVVDVAKTGDGWRFFDSGTLPSINWKSPDYNDAAWKSGNSQLGYGDGDESAIVSFGPDPNNKYVTTYFRKSFTLTDTAKVFDTKGTVLFDDGVIVYVNGNEVFRENMPAGTVANSTLASANQDNELLFHAFSINKKFLRNGMNTISAEVHQFTTSSSDISFDLSASMLEFGTPFNTNFVTASMVQGTASANVLAEAIFEPVPVLTTLVINEISATNTGTLDNAGQSEDWIELYNAGNSAINLDGLFISDKPNRKGKFKLTAGTSDWLLMPGGYQLLWADDDEKQGRDHLSFKLSSDGENLALYQLVGFDTVPIASIVFGKQPKEFSLARIPNATGAFQNTFIKTPGAANQQVPVVQNLVINEFSALPSALLDEQGDQDDWIELFNSGNSSIDLTGLFITDDPTNKLKHMLSADGQPWVLQPGAYQLLWCDADSLHGFTHLSFKLSGSGESIGLYQITGGDTIELSLITFGKQLDGFSSARLPNGTGPVVSTFAPTPGAINIQVPVVQNLVINEFSATPSVVKDEQGDHDDWIELFNSGSSPVSLNGLFISDDPAKKRKHLLHNGGQPWILQPGDYQVLWADNEEADGFDHLPFKLSGSGESIGLYQLTGGDTIELSSISFSIQLDGFSSARIPNGTGPFVSTFVLTPGAANQEAARITGLVLNEFSAIPSTALDEFGDQDDWIELFNAGSQPINMAGLFITDNSKKKLKYRLQNNGDPWLLTPGSYQLLWADDEMDEGVNHMPFKLSSGGDEIGMYQVTGGDTLQLFSETFPFQSPGYSSARLPNGSGEFTLTPNITPGAENTALPEGQILYPNPADSEFRVLLKEDNAALSVYDQFGSKLTTYYFSTPHEAIIGVSGLGSGFYYVKIVYSTATITTPLIIAR